MKQKLFAMIVVSLAMAGCSQGLGDRCQVSSDCSSGLTCNEASMVCAYPVTGDASTDAYIPIDAAASDAPAVDAQ